MSLVLVCTAPLAHSATEPPRLIVTTTSILADAVRSIASPESTVIALMREGTDPHTYKASPGDLRILSDASILFVNGLHLEGRLSETLVKLQRRMKVHTAADAVRRDKLRELVPGTQAFDPHIWFDPSLWALAVEGIGAALAQLDPERAPDYKRRTNEYTSKLLELHTWSAARIATIPAQRRILITAHDAFGYFGRAYDVKVFGIQGLSTESEPTIQTINSLVNLIVTERVPAVFIESSVSPRAVRALLEGARAQGVTTLEGPQLFSDSLGPPNTDAGTYLGMVRHNVEAITTALSRGSEQ
jgi:manganese/zinc/iron transport system substrate-binding protein